MFSVGVLVFLLVDVLAHGLRDREDAVNEFNDGDGASATPPASRCCSSAASELGSAGLGILERRMRRAAAPADRGRLRRRVAAETEALAHAAAAAPALRTGLIIAAAIGLHNFAEGLAIGVSAQRGEIGLATVLIIGFALHNATEGFGIVGPLGDVRPTWRWLALAG